MPIIEVNHVTKEYRLGSLTSLKQSIIKFFTKILKKGGKSSRPFKALDDINFTINAGEVVGLIGQNGAGKSTLLKHLAAITKPTHGKVIVKGSVAPLIEVGAGLNPELTGRENIFLNGAILGIPKKIIRQKMDDIIAFAELEDFIDTPVKRYSSGMTVRLGFSIATSIDADILIIDEVLAVGDLAFQRKCFERMEEIIKHKNKTVLIVSHNIRQIARICDRVLLLQSGKLIDDNDADTVCNHFYSLTNEKIKSNLTATEKNLQNVDFIKLNSIDIVDDNGQVIDFINSRDSLNVRVQFSLTKPVKRPEIIVGTHTADFVYLTASSTATFADRPDLYIGDHEIICTFASFPLIEGKYLIRFSIFDEQRGSLLSGESLKEFEVKEPHGVRGEHGWMTLNLPTSWQMQGKSFEAPLFNLG